MKFWLLAAVLLCGFGFWTLFGTEIKGLPLRCAPYLVAKRRLKQFARSGKKARVVCFGALKRAEDPGFHFVFDAVLSGEPRLDRLAFSSLEPPSAVKMAEDYQGRTAEAYCFLHKDLGLQLIGTLGQSDGFCLYVQKIKLSGRAGEIFIAKP